MAVRQSLEEINVALSIYRYYCISKLLFVYNHCTGDILQLAKDYFYTSSSTPLLRKRTCEVSEEFQTKVNNIVTTLGELKDGNALVNKSRGVDSREPTFVV